jgi:5-methylcytosine-specific restriction endonuclease McrA
MLTEQYLYKKVIDWSALNYGINIPVSLQPLFYDNANFHMKRGDTKKITIILEDIKYSAYLINIGFDGGKYPNHKDLLQIRYNTNSAVAKKLRDIFSISYEWLKIKKKALKESGNSRKQLLVPENISGNIIIYSTEIDDVIIFECVTCDEIAYTKQFVQVYNEIEIEAILNMSDDSSTLIEKSKIIKTRKLNKSICSSLKHLYEYKCQICGKFIGEKYDTNVIHSHHIEPFSLTLNNNPDNIMIICPNHHGIVHATNPIFNRKDKCFIYPNGYIEELKINLHL